MFGKKKQSSKPFNAAERLALQGYKALEDGNAQLAIDSFRAGTEAAPLDRAMKHGLHQALALKAYLDKRAKEEVNRKVPAGRKPTKPVRKPAPFVDELEEFPETTFSHQPEMPAAKRPTKRQEALKQTQQETQSRGLYNPGFSSMDHEEPPPPQGRSANGSRWKIPFQKFDSNSSNPNIDANAELDAALGTFAEEFKPPRDRRRFAHGERPQSAFARSTPWIVGIMVAVGFLSITAAAKQGLDFFLQEVALPKTSTQEELTTLPAELNTILVEASENLTNRKSADAVASLNTAWETYPDFQNTIRPVLVSALRVQGTELLNKQQYEEALKFFEKTTVLEPEDENNWIEYGRSLREYGRRVQTTNSTRSQVLYERSKAAYSEALENDSNNISALFGLGQVYFLMQNRAEAVSKYQRVVALSPGSPEARKAQEFLAQMIGSNS